MLRISHQVKTLPNTQIPRPSRFRHATAHIIYLAKEGLGLVIICAAFAIYMSLLHNTFRRLFPERHAFQEASLKSTAIVTTLGCAIAAILLACAFSLIIFCHDYHAWRHTSVWRPSSDNPEQEWLYKALHNPVADYAAALTVGTIGPVIGSVLFGASYGALNAENLLFIVTLARAVELAGIGATWLMARARARREGPDQSQIRLMQDAEEGISV